MYSTKTPNYRSLSSPMRIQLNMSNIMKRSGKGTVYEDLVADYNIESLLLKLSYRDILELRKYFGGEPKLEDQKQHSELRKLSGEKEPVRIKTIYESESLLPFSDQSYLKEKEQDFNL